MYKLNTLKHTSAYKKSRNRVGRGIGSGLGKTCGRGEKGAKSRSGYKRRYGYEGGQFRLYMKLPIRGFSNARFRKELDTINLDQIEHVFNDGDVVNEQSLREHGFINGPSNGIKVLGNGELTKKVVIKVNALSASARDKIQKSKITFELLNTRKDA